MKRSSTAGEAASTLTASRSFGTGWACQFLVELVTEHDDVLELRGQCSLIRMLPAVPNLRFPHEIEPATLDHRRSTGECVRPEEDCRAEDSLEGSDEPTVLFPTDMHPKGFQHLGSGPESDRLAFLLYRQGCKEDWHEAVLPEGHAEVGMACDLEDELSVPPFIKKLVFRQAPDRQAQSTNGRELKQRSCVRCSRLIRTTSIRGRAPVSVWR